MATVAVKIENLFTVQTDDKDAFLAQIHQLVADCTLKFRSLDGQESEYECENHVVIAAEEIE